MNDSTHLPYSPAAERNAPHILEVLRTYLPDDGQVLEIGSGSAQHAVHFATALPGLRWQCTDRDEYLDGIHARLAQAGLSNLPPAVPLDVGDPEWPAGPWDAIYSANTLHIMSWPEVRQLFHRLPDVLKPRGLLVIYGPFRRNDQHTSPSNAHFDLQLRAAAPHRGIRDLEAVHELATASGLQPMDDRAMPANNACVVWRRGEG